VAYADREAEAERIDQMYEDVEDAVIAILVAAYAAGIPEGVSAATAEAKAVLWQAYQQAQVWIQEAIPALYGEEVSFSGEVIDGLMTTADAQFRSMTETAVRRLDDLASQFYAAEARRAALAEFQRTRYALGARGLAVEMERTLRDAGITGFTDAAGRRWKLKTYAEMAARTVTMEAENAGVKDRVVASGRDLVNIVGPMDYPDGCPPSVLGGPYSVTGATVSYQGRDIMTLSEAISYYGVFHPRCRHSLSPA
jgi:hypothetical protein